MYAIRQTLLRAATVVLFIALAAAPALAQDAPGHEGHNHGGGDTSTPLPISPPEFVVFIVGAVLALNVARKAMVHRPWSATAEELATRPDIASAKRALRGLLIGLVVGTVLLPVYLPLHERLHHGGGGNEPLASHAGHDHEANPHDEEEGSHHSPLVYLVSPVVLGAIGSLALQLKPPSDTTA